MSTETVGLLGTGAQDGHLDFHTAPEVCIFRRVFLPLDLSVLCKEVVGRPMKTSTIVQPITAADRSGVYWVSKCGLFRARSTDCKRAYGCHERGRLVTS